MIYGTERQLKNHVIDARARWETFKLVDVRRLGACKKRWRCLKVFLNSIEQAVPVVISESIFICLSKKNANNRRHDFSISRNSYFFKESQLA